MIYLFLNKRIFCILLFYFSALGAQKISIFNNSNESVTVKIDKKEIVINGNDKKEMFDIKEGLSLWNVNRLDRHINLFLETTEKLGISIEKDNTIIFSGDKSSIHEYINAKLNIETFGKINDYVKAVEKRNLGELIKSSEFLLLGILKNIKQDNIVISEKDTNSVRKMKNYVKYNWIYTILSSVNGISKDKNFKKDAINYYYKKYIEEDIQQYSCTDFFPYNTLEILAKNKVLLQAKLPVYPIIESTHEDSVNQYLPKDCQKFYFLGKYRYLEHINNPGKDYYKKVLDEKFNN